MQLQNQTSLGEKTLLRNERFGEYELVGAEWIAYVTLTRKGRMILDAKLDRNGVGDETALAFLADYKEQLLDKVPFENFEYRGRYILIIYSRNKEYFHVANIYIRRETPFDQRDITWMRLYTRANMYISDLYEDLLEQQECVNATFNSLTSAMLTLDKEGEILLYNSTAADLLGLDRRRADQDGLLAELLPPSVWTRAKGAIASVLETHQQVRLEDVYLFFEGMHQIYSFTFSPLIGIGARVSGIILAIEDVTTQTLLDLEIEQRAQYEVLSEVALGLAHDIKNPLTNILGCARIGTRRECPANTRKEMMDIISHEVNRISLVLTQMLTYGKLTQHSPKAEIDVNATLELCMSVIERQKFERKIRITAILDPELPPVCAREIQLQQVFLNVLINALQAIPHEGEISVSSSLDSTEGHIRIDILDTGVGFDAEQQEQLFKPYFTTKKNGTGLGLFASKKIVEQCGGTIELMPRPTGGAHCRITFPVH